MKKYKALVNLPGGIKKGDIITFERNISRKEIDNTVVHYNPEVETDFFKEFIPFVSNHQEGELVMLLHKDYVIKSKGGRSTTMRKRTVYQTVPPFVELKVLKVFEAGVTTKTVKYRLYYRDGNVELEVEQSKVKAYKPYYFISSSGVIQKTAHGQNNQADIFRKLVSNYYATAEEARSALDKMKTKSIIHD